MAEFHFYAVAEDIEGIFFSLSEQGGLQFIPDRSYPTKEHIVLKGVRTEADRSLSQNGAWYIMGSFTKEPPCVREIKGPSFYISLEYDGLLISLRMPSQCRIENGIRELVPGCLHHPRAYWDRAITEARKVPDDVKASYADIVKTIKLHLSKRKIDQILWVGKNAAKQLDEGRAIILSNGKWWNGNGEFIKSNLSPPADRSKGKPGGQS